MKTVERKSAEILKQVPPVDAAYVEALLAKELEESQRKIVVLDDDPTGVQTVHDIFVYTDWEKESIRQGFLEENRLFYILTNSRGMTKEQTRQVHSELAHNLAQVSRETGKDFLVISRSDSTLRGHYPLETEVLKTVLEEETGEKLEGEILCPFFQEGGRFTIEDIHYVQDRQTLIPAGETEFAKDKTFGYQASDIRDYVEEKTKGAYPAEQVVSISLADLRHLKLDKITDQLLEVKAFHKVIVNAVEAVDVKIFCIALYRALKQGKRFLFRTAAAFVKEMGGVSAQPLLKREQMVTKETEKGGVVIVGSHTQKTTRQLEALRQTRDVVLLAFDSDLVLQGQALEQEAARVVREMEELVQQGKTAVVYTKRRLLTIPGESKEEALLRSVKISDAVQSLVGNLTIEPSFVIAKGGITSSDIGTKALRVKRAKVLGQICPGIPVWQILEESKFPYMPYIIFPGNVGEEETLKRAVEILCCKA